MNKQTFRSFCTLMLFLFLFLLGCERSPEEVESPIDEQMYFHVSSMLFYHTAHSSGPRWRPTIGSSRHDWREYFTDLVLVHSEDEAVGFPSDVVVAWPSDRTQLIVDAINRRIRNSEGEIDPESFGLSYPLTVEDTVNYWQQVDDFFVSLENFSRIVANARSPEPRIWDDEGNLIDIDGNLIDGNGNIIENEDTGDD